MRIKYKLILSVLIIVLATALPLSFYISQKGKEEKMESIKKIGRLNSKLLAKSSVDIIMNADSLLSAKVDIDDLISVFSELESQGLIFAQVVRLSSKEKNNGKILSSFFAKSIRNSDDEIINAIDIALEENITQNKKIVFLQNKKKLEKSEIKYKIKHHTIQNVTCIIGSQHCMEFNAVANLPNKKATPFILTSLQFSRSFILEPIEILKRTILKATLIAIFIAILIAYLMSKLFTIPISRLKLGADYFAKGEYDYHIKINSNDEFGNLAHAFNSMSSQIHKSEKFKVEQASTQKEMDIARSIQTSLLPSDYKGDVYSFIGYMKTADDVGGDMYDFIKVQKSSSSAWWFFIGDVSGHGLESGLVMLMAQTALRNTLSLNFSLNPALALTMINRTLYHNMRRLKSDKYMTAALLKADENGNFSMAGLHLDIMIYRYKTKTLESIASDGMWLGVLENIKEESINIEFKLEFGDVLLLYTDGLTEAMNKNGEIYDESRLKHQLLKNGNQSLEKIKLSILDDLYFFTGLSSHIDDISFTLIRKE